MQLLVLVAVALLMFIVVGALSAAAGLADVPLMQIPYLYAVQAVTQVLTMAVPTVVIAAVYFRGRQRAFYRMDFGGRRWLMALAGMVVMLLIVPLDEALTRWNEAWDLGALGESLRAMQDTTEGLVNDMFAQTSVGGLLVNLLVIGLVPAVCEELFFRTGIQNLLERWFTGNYEGAAPRRGRGFGMHAAVWVTAAVFSLFHGEMFSFMPRLLMGAVLGYLYVYGGSLLVNMAAHFINNATLVVLYWLYSNGLSPVDPTGDLMIGWPVTVCCTLAALTLFYTTFIMKRDPGAGKNK